MATYYVDSSATGSNNGSSKANAFTSFYTAVSSTASGDILLVSHTHSEDFTVGTIEDLDKRRAISINFSDDSYTFGAKIYASSNNLGYLGGIFYGMEIDCITRDLYLENIYAYDCKFGTGKDSVFSTAGTFYVGINGKLTILKKCRFLFRNVSTAFNCFRTRGIKSFARYEECSLDSGSSALESFFNNGGLEAGNRVEINGFDLSNASPDLIFINKFTSLNTRPSVKVDNIKLPATWPNSFGTLIGSFAEWTNPGWAGNGSFSAVDDPLDEFTYNDYSGEITADSTIYRTATTGTTNYSLKYVTNLTAAAGSMFDADSLQYVVSTFFSRANPTITVHAFGDHATILTDQEFWIEVEYPLSGGVRGFSSTLHSNLIMGTGTNVTATGSASDWTGESGSNQRFYNPSITISDGEPGIYRVKVYLARTSETLYVDPRVDIT